ncbi:MAG: sugar ABC transporter permease [Clostridiales bacterium]|nr:sugar ABC transporter permease [Clostridiales bacterium]
MRKAAVYSFLIPSFVGFCIFFLIPFFGGLSHAFDVNGSFGAGNFTRTMQNEAFQLALYNTLLFLLVCVPLNVFLPLFTAIAVNSIGERSRLFKLSFISPIVVPVASVALFWSLLTARGGTMGALLSFLGLGEVDFLNSRWAIFVLALIYLWKYLGYMMILYLAGLSEIPRSFSESAAMDGAGWARRLAYVTLPCLRPTIFFVLVLSVANSFKVFREIFLIAGPYPNESIYMLQHYMNNMFSRGDYPMLTAAAYITAAIIIAFLLFLFAMNRSSQKRLVG